MVRLTDPVEPDDTMFPAYLPMLPPMQRLPEEPPGPGMNAWVWLVTKYPKALRGSDVQDSVTSFSATSVLPVAEMTEGPPVELALAEQYELPIWAVADPASAKSARAAVEIAGAFMGNNAGGGEVRRAGDSRGT